MSNVECLQCGVEMHPADADSQIKKGWAIQDTTRTIICTSPECSKSVKEKSNNALQT